MSRTPAEEAQAANQAKKPGHVTVLRAGPIPEIEAAPPITSQLLAGNEPGMQGMQPGTVDRPTQIQHLDVVAPVVADATRKNRSPREEDKGKGVEIVYAVVMNDKPMTVHDKASGGRVTLKPGKQCDSQHYDLVDLARQGVRFRRVEKTEDPNKIPDWIFNSATH